MRRWMRVAGWMALGALCATAFWERVSRPVEKMDWAQQWGPEDLIDAQDLERLWTEMEGLVPPPV